MKKEVSSFPSWSFWYNLAVRVFRSLIEAINSLGKGKVLFSTDEFLFNRKLAFYQKDVFENLSLDKYKMSYGDIGGHIFVKYFRSNGVDFGDDFYEISSRILDRFVFFHSEDLLRILEKLENHARSLGYLREEIVDFVQSSGKELSRLAEPYNYLLFSSFVSESVVTPQLLDDEDKKWLNSISGFWKNLVSGDSGVYNKFLSIFDGEFRDYVAKTVSLSGLQPGYYSIGFPFGYFDKGTRPLAFESGGVEGGVGLFSYNSELYSDRIGDHLPRLLRLITFNKHHIPEEKYGDFFPKIFGCFDFYFGIDNDFVIIPVESEYENGEKTLVLHTFYVGTLLNDHFKFYVDGGRKVSRGKVEDYLNSEYRFNLYPNQENGDKGKVVIDLDERIRVELSWSDREEGVEELNLEAELLLNTSSFGEVVEVGGEMGLVPRGARVVKGGKLFILRFSVGLHPSLFEPYGGPTNLSRNRKLHDVFISILEKIENRFLYDLQSFDFFYERVSEKGSNKKVKENISFRDKRFLLNTTEVVVRESLKTIRDELKEKGEKGFERLIYFDIKSRTPESYSFIFSTRRKSLSADITLEELENYHKEVFENRRLYSRFIDQPNPELCFDSGGLRVSVIFPSISDKRAMDLTKVKLYETFVKKSLPDRPIELSKEQVEIYSLFLDLLPHDPSSVRYLDSIGPHETFRSEIEVGKRIMEGPIDPLDLGVIYTKWGMEVGIRIRPSESGKGYHVVPIYRYQVEKEVHEETFINRLNIIRFEYRIGNNAIEILGS